MKSAFQKASTKSFSSRSQVFNDHAKAKENGKSFLYNRLKQLAEDATQPDPSISIPKDALPFEQTSVDIQKLIDKLEKKKFEKLYQKELSYDKIPSYAGRHTKDLALARAWTGDESVHDSSLRAAVDRNKPLRSKQGLRPPKAKVAIRDRLHSAREASLDYTLSKFDSEQSGKSNESRKNCSDTDDGWSERYRERLLGVEFFGPTSISGTAGSIKALADRRIEDAKRNGAFDNLPNRGKPFARDFNAESAYIDRTEYHLNNILIRQQIVPPWIEKQGSVQTQIAQFKADLDNLWLRRAVIVINDRFSYLSIDQKLAKALEFKDKELKGEEGKLRDSAWVRENDHSLTTKFNVMNDTIRGYNLQAPLASQKLYFVKEKELNAMYKRTSLLLHDRLKTFLKGDQSSIKQIKPGSYLGYNDLPQREDQESLGTLFANMFKRL